MTKLDPPTEAQAAVLEALDNLTSVHGATPTLRVLADELGLTHPTVHEHLGHLVRMGWLRRLQRASAVYALTSAAKAALYPPPRPKRKPIPKRT